MITVRTVVQKPNRRSSSAFGFAYRISSRNSLTASILSTLSFSCSLCTRMRSFPIYTRCVAAASASSACTAYLHFHPSRRLTLRHSQTLGEGGACRGRGRGGGSPRDSEVAGRLGGEVEGARLEFVAEAPGGAGGKGFREGPPGVAWPGARAKISRRVQRSSST